ncbi:hypothetical protein PV10_07746 [Exophiala mesophila]|uniref:Major facilitator superfamily (MFS) profile domain-containing protein n=1 Tax=Exophiala mesophila TaxID=212818 RepID=A0A0D1Z8S4_EXOME|nr:uncharacterized protein PV10_07746 [Exophiala mesophila]KIV90439.1 hypothetical protein PV10_07746 [Exophiala mesophila]
MRNYCHTSLITALCWKVFGITENGKYIVSAMWLSLWAASSPLGGVIGALIAGWGQDRFGRRKTFVIASIFQAATITICYLASQVSGYHAKNAVYFVGKTIHGTAVGVLIPCAQVYASEVLPVQLRGSIQSLLMPFKLLGQLVAAVVIRSEASNPNPNAYRIPIAMQWVFSIIPLGLCVVLPESPIWLMRKSRWEATEKAAARLDGQELKHEGTTYIDIFRGPENRRRTFIVAFAGMVPPLTGLPLLGHSSYFTQLLGVTAENATTVFIGGVVAGLIANFVAFYFLTRIGRRPLLITGMAVVGFFYLTTGIVAIWPGDPAAWYTAAAWTTITIIAGLSAWPACYAVAGETSSLMLRGKNSGVGWFANALATFNLALVYPYIYNPDVGNLGGKTSFVAAGLSLIGSLIAWFIVPEMKNRTPIEIDRMFGARLPTRKFRSYDPASSP